MGFFGITRKKKEKKRQPAGERRLRQAELFRKTYVEKELVKMAQEDLAFKRQLICQTFKITLPDPAEGERLRLLAVINQEVIKRIEENPGLAERMADAKIFKTMREEGMTRDGERPSAMRQNIEIAKEVNELKELMGIKDPGILDALMKPEVLVSIIPMISGIISAIIGRKESSNSEETVVWVQQNGEEKRMTMAEFKQLKGEGRDKLPGEEHSSKNSNDNKDKNALDEINNLNETDGDIAQAGH